MFGLLIVFGIVVRFLLIGVPGFKADIAFWKGWGLAVADKGIIWLVNNTNYNYPPGFAYVLWVVNKIYALFKSPYDINDYWRDNNFLYLLIFKLITIGADLLIVWLIIKITERITNPKPKTQNSKQNENQFQIQNPKSEASHADSVAISFPASARDQRQAGKIAARSQEPWKSRHLHDFVSRFKFYVSHFNLGHWLSLFYFLNLAVIFDGVIWGQVDQFGLALFMLSIYFLLVDRPKRAAIVFTVAWLMKFQNIIFIPFFYVYIFKKYGWESLVKNLMWSVITFLVIVAPFWYKREIAGLIKLFTVNSDWFPWYSLNAFNSWWLAAGGKGLTLSDKTLVWGIVDAKTIGFLGFSFFYLIACLRVFLAEHRQLFREFILSSILIVFAFFHVLTQSHERYLFHLVGLWLILIIIDSQTRKYKLETNLDNLNPVFQNKKATSYELRIMRNSRHLHNPKFKIQISKKTFYVLHFTLHLPTAIICLLLLLIIYYCL